MSFGQWSVRGMVSLAVVVLVSGCHRAPATTIKPEQTVEATPEFCGNMGRSGDVVAYFYACGTGESTDLQHAQTTAFDLAAREIDAAMTRIAENVSRTTELANGTQLTRATVTISTVRSAGTIGMERDSTRVVSVKGAGTYRAWVRVRASRQAWATEQMNKWLEQPGFKELADTARARIMKDLTSGR